MSSLIQPSQGPSGVPAPPPAKPGSSRRAPQAGSTPKSEAPVSLDTIPTSPPPAVLEQVQAAGRSYEALKAQGFEVRYTHDSGSRKTTATLHDRSGAVVRTLSPSEAIELAAGGPPPAGR